VIIATFPRLLRPNAAITVRRCAHVAPSRRIGPIALFIDRLPERPVQFLFETLQLPPAESAKLNAELMAGNVFRKT
jgi:hypothetical protein